MPVDRDKVRRCFDVQESLTTLDEIGDAVTRAIIAVRSDNVPSALGHLAVAEFGVKGYNSMQPVTAERQFVLTFHNLKRRFEKLSSGSKSQLSSKMQLESGVEPSMLSTVLAMHREVDVERVVKACECAMGEIGR